jgi:ATP-dependent Clp protease ATP-binding subunit ClpA
MLLGVIRADAGTTCAPQMLRTKLRRARSVVASRLGRKQPVPDHEPELSLQAKRVLARSMAHADRRGHAGVDLEHLLLGLLDVLEESERPTLRAFGVGPEGCPCDGGAAPRARRNVLTVPCRHRLLRRTKGRGTVPRAL